MDRGSAVLLHRRRQRPGRHHATHLKVAAAIVMFATPPAHADEVTAKDVQVIGRTLGFMEDSTHGSLDLGIVYVRNDTESARQARTLAEMIGTGLTAGKVELHPRLIATDQLQALEQIGALFIVPAAAHAAASAAAAAAQRLHVPTLSTDVACAEAGECVIAFRTDPTVEITFSRAAAAGAAVRFTPAFRMLVKQV